MTEPTADPWLVFEVPGGFQVAAQCVPAESLSDLAADGADISFDGPQGRQRIIVATILTRSSWMVWRVRIRWPGMLKLGSLDSHGECLGCGREIVDAKVTSEGRILVGHKG